MQNKKAAILFIFFTLLIDVIGFGIIIPVVPSLLAKLNGVSINEASKYGGYLIVAFALTQFLFAPLIGNLSDKYGRRKVLLLSLVGFMIDYIILALAPTYTWLLIGRIIAGITGASFTTASAYIADISTDQDRTKNFGMIGAAFGIGFVVGPLLGGFLASFGERVPFYASAVLCFLNFLYGFFILPESLPLEKRRDIDLAKANPFSTIAKLFKYKGISWLLFALFLLYLSAHAVHSNWNYFTMYKFQWSAKQVGISLAIVGVLVGVIQYGMAQKIANKIGVSKTIIIGFGMYTIGLLFFALAPSTLWMYAALLPYCLGGIAMPNFQSLLVKQVPDNEQGELQGGLTSIQSLASIFGPYIMTNLFYHFTKPTNYYLPGAPFLLGCIFMLLSAVIVYTLLLKRNTLSN